MEKEVREERVLQSGSHGPAVWCMAETHHSANYDQAFPCRHSSAGNGKSLFSHTPIEAMGHGAMQMRSVYKHVHRHTNTGNACGLINTQRRAHSYTHESRQHKRTQSPFACLLMYVVSRLRIPAHKQLPTPPTAHDPAAPQKHLHTGNRTKKYIISLNISPRMHLNITMILSIKFTPTEPRYPSLLWNTILFQETSGVFN